MDKNIATPFTEDQVQSLNAYQVSDFMHPFTCGSGDDHGVLIAREDGWYCQQCDYTQNWAHEWMANWKWLDMKKALTADDKIIQDPIAWQEKIDAASAPLNLNGANRFWTTCLSKGLKIHYVNGTPEFSEIVFALDDEVGVELSIGYEGQFMKYRFVKLSDFKQ